VLTIRLPLNTIMFRTLKPLILASRSPRRRELLTCLSIRFSVEAPAVDETMRTGESPEAYVLRMAHAKAADVGVRHDGAWVIAADTIVVLDGTVLTKPDTTARAVDMLMQLSGREHQVKTAYCLFCGAERVCIVDSTMSRVRFQDFDQSWAKAYADTGEPMDKAGGYGIQERGGVLVEGIDGSYSNVVGLPMAEVVRLLVEHGVVAAGS